MLDKFGRNINYLRLSVTDRCDFRCIYCMPEKNNFFYPKSEILTLEQLKKISDILIDLGIKKIRITGGEPLIRKDIIEFLEYISTHKKEKKLKEILLTTNGSQLKKYSKKISQLGVRRINVSLDTLIPEKFNFVTKGGDLKKILEGIFEAQNAGLEIKINTVLLKKFNEDEIIKMVEWCSFHNFKQSFIEVMPVGELKVKRSSQYFPVSDAKKIIEKEFGLEKSLIKTNGPSRYFKTKKFQNTVGFISPISNNFCSDCNRIRVTSNGILYPCLGENSSIDLKEIIKKNKEEFSKIIEKIIFNKPERHSFSIENEKHVVDRFMNATGG